jgi:hypothetical protein
LVSITIWPLTALASTLAILPRAKAAFIAAIWARLRVSNEAARSVKLFVWWFRGKKRRAAHSALFLHRVPP